MSTIQHATTSLGLMVSINWDRILYVAALVLALGLGAWLGTLVNDAVLTPLMTP